MRVLIAGASLGGLAGRDVADAAAHAWRDVGEVTPTALAVSDGEHDLLDAVEARLGGRRRVVTAWRDLGSGGTAVPVPVLHVGDGAYVSGAEVLGRREEATADAVGHGTSHGIGQLVLEAIGSGARRVVVGVGVGAVADAGLGALHALAGCSPDERDVGVDDLGELDALVRRARASTDGVELVLAASETVPARGLRGAAARLKDVVGPGRAQELDAALAPTFRALGDLVPRRLSLLGDAGAADDGARTAGSGGGLGAAVLALGGRVVDGASFLAADTGLTAAAQGCDLVVACVPRIDPLEADRGVLGVVAAAGAAHGVAVLGLAPSVRLDRRAAAGAGISATGALVRCAAALAADGPAGEAHLLVELLADLRRHARAWNW